MTKGPTYDAVRSDVRASMDALVELLPEGTQISVRPEGDPYPCSDDLALGSGDGVFYTGQLEATLPAGFDTTRIINGLPKHLDSTWQVSNTGVKLPSAAIVLTDTSRQVQLNVMDVSKGYDESPTIDITGISRCAEPPVTPHPSS